MLADCWRVDSTILHQLALDRMDRFDPFRGDVAAKCPVSARDLRTDHSFLEGSLVAP